MTILMKAPAKINLTLDVLYKRTDGYHEVEMVMTTIDLADRLELRPRDDGKIVIETSASYVPADEHNLAYKAAKLIQERFQVTRGVTIAIDKRIPVAAGLGGGSSDAAATIKGLNQLWDLGLSTEEMAVLGAEVGSDVPFCIYGGTALAKGRGEQITPLPGPPPFWIVLAKPPIGVSTAHVYQHLDLGQVSERPKTEQMIEALKRRDFSLIVKSMGNVLETVTLKSYPEVQHLKQKLAQFGADGVLMSGSGPTVFGLTQKESRAQRIYNGLKGFCQDVYMVRSAGT
ncbi:4-diphosphocytidyl-2-C-methyl-D-erythritol kinase [Caldalkalibacillus thermarum]|uniref:4-(cytidine 5'-diphospho)-2-C-methyl-D-erythritol kinase n=1 Tax=Caldalkalibacillus thermarum TaxID=296745 RepID=UPI001666D78E|nr:4-(cytidine 5'-diphospho)-2-C-methyl-D-erythritol kinase [Caldalkalibacillus thermarum]GGK32022.1 4-diphosphocytidyl-2-C-methyl-D-erythritol kinase [Caldalkalibacillus thermarum]